MAGTIDLYPISKDASTVLITVDPSSLALLRNSSLKDLSFLAATYDLHY